MNKTKLKQAIAACAEFECSVCPYKHLEHHHYKLRCIHTLMQDIHQEMEKQLNSLEK